MDETVLLGRGSQLVPIPRRQWEQHLTAAPAHTEQRLRFMTLAHHRVRYYAVEQLARTGAPVTPETIAAALDLSPEYVVVILAELEQELFFLVRDAEGNVTWAFPVTVEKTPHLLRFSSGERLYAA